jgi:hypothetical protein
MSSPSIARAPARDLRVDELVGAGPGGVERAPEPQRADLAQGVAHTGLVRGRVPHQRRDAVAQLGLVAAEDDAHDDAEGQPPHLRQQRERLPDRPALDHVGGELVDQVAVAAQALAVEGREHDLALTQVLVAVEDQQ